VVDAPEGNGTGFILDQSGHVVTNCARPGGPRARAARAPAAAAPGAQGWLTARRAADHVLQSALGRVQQRPGADARPPAAKVALVTVLLGARPRQLVSPEPTQRPARRPDARASLAACSAPAACTAPAAPWLVYTPGARGAFTRLHA